MVAARQRVPRERPHGQGTNTLLPMILRFGKAVCCAHRNVPGTSAWLTTVGQRQLIVIGYQRLRYKQRPQQGSANVGIAFGIRFSGPLVQPPA